MSSTSNMSLSRVKIVTEDDLNDSGFPRRCVFCKSDSHNELKYGPMYDLDGTTTHYFCMLFSAALKQEGKDFEGILGFFTHDIIKEVRRSSRLRCVYCNDIGASIGCCNKRCRQTFHFPCGLENRANYQFYGNFESYCPTHAKVQKITLKETDWVCPVCMGPVGKDDHPVQASCCSAAVFHKECMQKVALNAGYFFKCPTCNASQNFVQEMRSMGIYVPEQDASWEREPDAFQELLYQYSKCDAINCDCAKGRDYSTPEGSWSYARCRVCGAAGVHKKCGQVKDVDDWACESCSEVEKKAEEEINKQKLEKQKTEAEEAEKKAEAERLANLANDTENEDFRMSDIVISRSCFHYFPYDKSDLEKFDKNHSIPDWRNLHLEVDLVNWIKCVKVGGVSATSTRSAKNKNSPTATSTRSLKTNNDSCGEPTHRQLQPVEAKKRGRKRKAPLPKCETSIKVEPMEIVSADEGEQESVTIVEVDPTLGPSKAESPKSSNIENDDTNLQIVNVNTPTDDVSRDEHYSTEKMQAPVSAPVKSEQAKSKCAIVPFVSNFLKAGAAFRDKRRMELTSQSAPSPAKKVMKNEPDSGGELKNESSKLNSSSENSSFEESNSNNLTETVLPNNTPENNAGNEDDQNNSEQSRQQTLQFSREMSDMLTELRSRVFDPARMWASPIGRALLFPGYAEQYSVEDQNRAKAIYRENDFTKKS